MYTPHKEICEPFILSKHHIEHIAEIIANRKPANADEFYNPVYTYKRLDNYEITTTDINKLFSEENHGRTRIVSLEISSDHYQNRHSGLNYTVEFNSCENDEEFDFGFYFFKSINLSVDGTNEDLTQLLYSDLDNYIMNSIVSHRHQLLVSILRRFNFFSVVFALLILLSFCVLPYPMFQQNNHNMDLLNNALLNDDIVKKLDAILMLHKQNVDSEHIYNNFIYIVMPIAIVGIIAFIFRKKLKKWFCFCMPFVFDFGTSPEDYTSRTKKIKLFLGAIGTILLALIASFLYAVISPHFFK